VGRTGVPGGPGLPLDSERPVEEVKEPGVA
jgi:hypothetical protein